MTLVSPWEKMLVYQNHGRGFYNPTFLWSFVYRFKRDNYDRKYSCNFMCLNIKSPLSSHTGKNHNLEGIQMSDISSGLAEKTFFPYPFWIESVSVLEFLWLCLSAEIWMAPFPLYSPKPKYSCHLVFGDIENLCMAQQRDTHHENKHLAAPLLLRNS